MQRDPRRERSTDSQDAAVIGAPLDWGKLGERIRRAASAAAAVHLSEAACCRGRRVAAWETSPGNSGG